MNMIKRIEVVCPSCGSAGEIEREISVPDFARGGEIIGQIEICDMCEGRGAIDPLEHEPWEPCVYFAEKLQLALEDVANASVAPSSQANWDTQITAALAAFDKLKDQMTILKEWKYDR